MGKENKTVYVILGFLNHEDLTGYDIKKRIDTVLSYFWGAGFGQIYPTLSLLERKGWVTKRNDSMGQKIERIIYAITDEGRDNLILWLAKPSENDKVKYEILLKLFFGSALDVQKNIDHIEKFKNNYEKELPVLKGFEKNLTQVKDEVEDTDHLYYLLTVLFGEKIYGAYLEWSNEALALLKTYQKKEYGGKVHE